MCRFVTKQRHKHLKNYFVCSQIVFCDQNRWKLKNQLILFLFLWIFLISRRLRQMRDLKEIDKQQLWGSKNSLGRWAIFYVQKILDFLENGKKVWAKPTNDGSEFYQKT